MQRLILVLPNCVRTDNEASELFCNSNILKRIAAEATIGRLKAEDSIGVHQAAYLGLNPNQTHLAKGPLTVSALGVDPPERSVSFRLTLLSCSETGSIHAAEPQPNDAELDEIFSAAAKLESQDIRLIRGYGITHGLVDLSGSDYLVTVSPEDALTKSVSCVLPQGEREQKLRQFIDDSINLLSGLHFNRIRLEEGQRPLNLLWPSDQGFRIPMPNLSLRYGTPIHAESSDLLFKGLSRLCGVKHGSVQAFTRGLSSNWNIIAQRFHESNVLVALSRSPGTFVMQERADLVSSELEEIERSILIPLWENRLSSPCMLTLLSPNENSTGIYLHWNADRVIPNDVPYDPRVLDDPKLPTTFDWEVIQKELSCVIAQS